MDDDNAGTSAIPSQQPKKDELAPPAAAPKNEINFFQNDEGDDGLEVIPMIDDLQEDQTVVGGSFNR